MKTENNENIELDQLDFDIISILKKKSRISLPKLSEKLQKHINTIRERKKKLEKKKIIKEYSIKVNYEKLGFQPILFLINSKKGNSLKLPESFPLNLIIKTFDNKTIILTFLSQNNFISNLDKYLTFFSENNYDVKYSIVKTIKEE